MFIHASDLSKDKISEKIEDIQKCIEFNEDSIKEYD